jgi:hypothetical protein
VVDGDVEVGTTTAGTGRFADFVGGSAGAFPRTGTGGESVVVSSTPDLCGTAADLIEPPNSFFLFLFMTVSPPGGTLPPGVYAIGAEPNPLGDRSVSVGAFAEHTDASCVDTLMFPVALTATGELEIFENSDERVSGRFDVLFGEDHLEGRFDAPRCFEAGTDLRCGAI